MLGKDAWEPTCGELVNTGRVGRGQSFEAGGGGGVRCAQSVDAGDGRHDGRPRRRHRGRTGDATRRGPGQIGQIHVRRAHRP